MPRDTDFFEVYSLRLEKTAVLHNAFHRVIDTPLNGVATASFSLPEDDPKAEHCRPFHFIKAPDGTMFRILKDGYKSGQTGELTFTCEHAIATLVDDIMFQDVHIGGYDFRTRDVLAYLLNGQTVKRWQLGGCDFDRRFEYAFSSENLLNAMFSVPNRFAQNYMWTYNFATYPWTVSLKLVNANAEPAFYLRAERNLISSDGEQTMEDFCTRLYALGQGEGVNQLTIADVNGGIPYLQSPASYIEKYGLVSKVWVDRRFEHAESLKERAQALLNAMQEPQYRRSFRVLDLYEITNQRIDRAEAGDKVRLTMDGSEAYVTRTRRNLDQDGEVTLEMSTTYDDIAASISDLAERQRIEQVYSQGATQIYAQSVQANADTGTPAVLNFYIPQEMRIVNRVAVKVGLDRFRSYSRTTRGGGGTTRSSSEGGGSQQTSDAGGGSQQTSSAGGEVSTGTGAGGETTVSAEAREVKTDNSTGMPFVEGCQTEVTQMAIGLRTGTFSGSTGTYSGSYTSDVSLSTDFGGGGRTGGSQEWTGNASGSGTQSLFKIFCKRSASRGRIRKGGA